MGAEITYSDSIHNVGNAFTRACLGGQHGNDLDFFSNKIFIDWLRFLEGKEGKWQELIIE